MGRIKAKRIKTNALNYQFPSEFGEEANFMHTLGVMASKYPDAYYAAKKLRDKAFNDVMQSASIAKESVDMTEAFYWILLNVSVTESFDRVHAEHTKAMIDEMTLQRR